jgi:uncharacterized protein (TIGR03435 family)
MLRALPAARFQLKAHREMRDTPVCALAVGKSGAKLKLKGRNNAITLLHASMSEVVDAVDDAFLNRPVVEGTGLTGVRDIELTYTPNRRGEPELGDISVFAAVEEQLGLKLEPRNAPVEFPVVDSVEKPSANRGATRPPRTSRRRTGRRPT